jgi:lipopolysaccharide transport system permease protein
MSRDVGPKMQTAAGKAVQQERQWAAEKCDPGNDAQSEATSVHWVAKPLVIEPTSGLASLRLRAVWEYRELLYFLVWRDLKVRYRQTALGALWVVLQPLLSMVVFSFLFGGLLKVPSGNVPYPIFSYAALLPWNYFAGSLTRASTSLVGDSNLITKVYFPRLVIPLAGVVSGLVDFLIALIVLAGLMVHYRVAPTLAVLSVPVFLVLAVLTALGFGLWLSALCVRYRDVYYLVPFLVQIWMYLTPVIYSSSLVSQRFPILLVINPMTVVVEGFRWALLAQVPVGAQSPSLMLALPVLLGLAVLAGGMLFFRGTERSFADII